MMRFLQKVWRLAVGTDDHPAAVAESGSLDTDTQRVLHQTIRKVTEDIDALRLNTAISQMMILVNALQKAESIPKADLEVLIKLLNPFAPHIAEELWQRLGNRDSIARAKWPTYDPAKLEASEFQLVVQINGKVRAQIMAAKGISEDAALELAKAEEPVAKALEAGVVKRVIFVPDKLLNLVIPK